MHSKPVLKLPTFGCDAHPHREAHSRVISQFPRDDNWDNGMLPDWSIGAEDAGSALSACFPVSILTSTAQYQPCLKQEPISNPWNRRRATSLWRYVDNFIVMPQTPLGPLAGWLANGPPMRPCSRGCYMSLFNIRGISEAPAASK